MLRPAPPAQTPADQPDDWHAALVQFLGTRLPRRTEGPDAAGPPRIGLNFAEQDYLGLGRHPAIRSAALGQHPSPGSTLQPAVLRLEERIAAFLALPAAVTFPSGTEAIRQTLRALLHPGDDVIIDCGCPPAVTESALLAQTRVHRSPAASVDGIERRLARLSRQPRHGKLVIVVPTVSAQGSRIARLDDLAALARQHGAVLVADVTHDLGALGPGGGGMMEILGCLGRIDVVLGSFAKSFAATGGFATFRDPALKSALQAPPWQRTALSPVNAGVILAALDIVASAEGRRRRRNLNGISLRLRNHLMADGIKVMGKASPFVPILLPMLTAVPRTALLESAGPRVALLQAPSVPAHAPRWRIQLTADHSPADIDDLAELIRDVSRAFDRPPLRTRVPA